MRRNTKIRSEGFAFPIPIAAVIVLLVTFGIGYVCLKQRCEIVAQQIRELEQKQTRLNQTLLNEECNWTLMKAPANLQRALDRWRIAMTWPRPEQIVRVRASGPDDPARRLQGTVAKTRTQTARTTP
jgi:hypothetical protein